MIGTAAAAGIPAASGATLPGAVAGAAGIAPTLATAAVSATAVALVGGLGTVIAIFPPASFPGHRFEAFSAIFKENNGTVFFLHYNLINSTIIVRIVQIFLD